MLQTPSERRHCFRLVSEVSKKQQPEEVESKDEMKSSTCFLIFAMNFLAGPIDTVSVLLTYTTDLNVKNKYGETVMHYAVRRADVNILKLLLDRNPDVSVKGKEGTPFEIASAYKLPQAIALLNCMRRLSE
jgi:ankyrin repeat protein